MPDNSRIFVTAPESAPDLAFLPATGNQSFDAAVLICLLTSSGSVSLVKKLLEWQNRLRMLLLDLFAVRREIAKVKLSQDPIVDNGDIVFACTLLSSCAAAFVSNYRTQMFGAAAVTPASPAVWVVN